MAREYEVFRVERRGAVALLWMNRPEKLNAMGPTFFRELPLVLDDLGRDDELGAIVLTGAGDAFSAGGDIGSFRDLQGMGMKAIRRHLRAVFDAFHAVERAELPVIGAINGVAYGGGTELTLACDIVLASEERARFAFREATVGLTPGYGIVRGPDVIGRSWTRWLAMTADVIDARKALELGLVQVVVPHDALLDEAIALGERIAANPSLAIRVTKNFVNRDTGGRGLEESIEATALLWTTDEHRERVAGFLAGRRAPIAGPS